MKVCQEYRAEDTTTTTTTTFQGLFSGCGVSHFGLQPATTYNIWLSTTPDSTPKAVTILLLPKKVWISVLKNCKHEKGFQMQIRGKENHFGTKVHCEGNFLLECKGKEKFNWSPNLPRSSLKVIIILNITHSLPCRKAQLYSISRPTGVEGYHDSLMEVHIPWLLPKSNLLHYAFYINTSKLLIWSLIGNSVTVLEFQ